MKRMTAHSYTTRTLRAISYLWMSMPLTYLLYAKLVIAANTKGVVAILLSPSYWAVSALAFAAGRGILLIRWYGWYAFILSNITLAYITAVTLAQYSARESEVLVFLATGLVQLSLIFLVGREIRVPYFFPKIRWWESDPRYKLSVPVKIIRPDKSELEAEIMDISLGGCFMKTHHYFLTDELVVLNFTLFERPLNCPGKIVWTTESTVTHPRGIGIKFEPLDKDTTYCLKQATEKLRKLARAYSQMTRERNWQEYLQREQQFQNKKPNDESNES